MGAFFVLPCQPIPAGLYGRVQNVASAMASGTSETVIVFFSGCLEAYGLTIGDNNPRLDSPIAYLRPVTQRAAFLDLDPASAPFPRRA